MNLSTRKKRIERESDELIDLQEDLPSSSNEFGFELRALGIRDDDDRSGIGGGDGVRR